MDRATLETALAKGKLKGALARAFKTNEVSAPADLGERIEAALRQSTLDRLGLEARAGNLILGAEKIDVAARKGEVVLLLHAADSREDGRRKLDQAWRVGSDDEGSGLQGLVLPVERPILSMALGRKCGTCRHYRSCRGRAREPRAWAVCAFIGRVDELAPRRQ